MITIFEVVFCKTTRELKSESFRNEAFCFGLLGIQVSLNKKNNTLVS